MIRRTLALSFCLMGVLTASVRAETWSITSSDFRQSEVNVAVLTAKALEGRSISGAESQVRIALPDLVSMSRPMRVESPTGLVLCTADGGRLVGQPRGIEGQTLHWFVAGVGEMAVPLEQVLGVLRDSANDAALIAPRDEDEIRLQNGDVVRGIMTAIDEKTFTLTPSTGDPILLDAAVVDRVLVAAPPQGRPATAGSAFVLRMTNGTVLPCAAVTIEDSKFSVVPLGAEPRDVPGDRVAVIEHTAGRVRWLTAQAPIEAVYIPFFGGTYPHRMGRTVGDAPIRYDGKISAHGIGVHSRSVLTFAIEPGSETFRTQYAVEDNLPYADVDVRIAVDGKIVHEQKGVRSGTLSDIVQVDVRNAKSLILEIDYGQNYDIQDRCVWIEPALIRSVN